jgi:hypothetical protein
MGNGGPCRAGSFMGQRSQISGKQFVYVQLQKLATVRASLPALRYGRFDFRTIFGDGVNFGVQNRGGSKVGCDRLIGFLKCKAHTQNWAINPRLNLSGNSIRRLLKKVSCYS